MSRPPIWRIRRSGPGSCTCPKTSRSVSDHNGVRLRLMYQLGGDWIEVIGDPDEPDEMFGCLLEANDCFQGATFNFLHGFYRTALAELRTALELVISEPKAICSRP